MKEPILFERKFGTIALEMSEDDWSTLLLLMGMAIGSCLRQGNMAGAYSWTEFVNRLNRDNPNLQPYGIP